MHPIIAGEMRKAEALLEKYLDLPPSTIDLAVFDIGRFKNIPASLKRTTRRLQIVSKVRSPSQEEFAFVINAVDFIEQEVSRPRQNLVRRILFKCEKKLSALPVLALARHGAVTLGSFYGVSYCNSQELDSSQTAYYFLMSVAAIASVALLANSRLRNGAIVVALAVALAIASVLIPLLWEPAATGLIFGIVGIGSFVADLALDRHIADNYTPALPNDFMPEIDHKILANPYAPSIIRNASDIQRNTYYGSETATPDRYL